MSFSVLSLLFQYEKKSVCLNRTIEGVVNL